MWQINDIIYYASLLGFYISMGLAATFGRKSRTYFKLNITGKATVFLLLAIVFYGLTYYLLYRMCKGFTFWFYFSGTLIAAGLITHLLLPLERWSGITKTR